MPSRKKSNDRFYQWRLDSDSEDDSPLPIFDSNGIENYVEVKKSPIQGMGLFAKRNIPKGTVFCYYSGNVDFPAGPINPQIPDSGRGILGWGVNEEAGYDAVNTVSGHYANSPYHTGIRHNAIFTSQRRKVDKYGRKSRCVLQSTKAIAKGTEILLDYGPNYTI